MSNSYPEAIQNRVHTSDLPMSADATKTEEYYDAKIAELKAQITKLNSEKYKAAKKRKAEETPKKYILWMIGGAHGMSVAFGARDKANNFFWGRNTVKEDADYAHLGTTYVRNSDMTARFGKCTHYELCGPDSEETMETALVEFESAKTEEEIDDLLEKYGSF